MQSSPHPINSCPYVDLCYVIFHIVVMMLTDGADCLGRNLDGNEQSRRVVDLLIRGNHRDVFKD